jgi:hypothetical protein
MAANAQNAATNNAHSGTIDGTQYKITDLDLGDGGTNESIMSGDDGGHDRDVTTSKRTTVSATILVPPSGAAGAFRAQEEYDCTFTKKTGVGVTGAFLCTQKNYAGATPSALKFTCQFISQGEPTWDLTGLGSGA